MKVKVREEVVEKARRVKKRKSELRSKLRPFPPRTEWGCDRDNRLQRLFASDGNVVAVSKA